MANLIKSGYFRASDIITGHIRYISYKEFNSWSAENKSSLKQSVDMGQIRLYCACCREDDLPLIITANHVVRVASNGNQEQHMESCPKSIYYNNWIEQSQKGVNSTEDSQVLFNISLPTVYKAPSTPSSSSSPSAGASTPREKRTDILDMAILLNKMAWEIQTFSKKKEIKEANKEGRNADWKYKSLDEFNRLIFGISNDIYCKCQGNVIPLISLCYRRDLFYAGSDWHRQWFMYAVIERVSEFKPARKYQYITVRMPSDKSNSKAVVRVATEDFDKLIGGYEDELPCTHRILTGFIRRAVFKNVEDGSLNEWINLSRGVIIRVSDNGLYVENEHIAAAANLLSMNNVIFKRPYFPLENYGGEIPTFEIERLHDKNLIIDYPDESEYKIRCAYGRDNEEYECICLNPNENCIENLMHTLQKG